MIITTSPFSQTIIGRPFLAVTCCSAFIHLVWTLSLIITIMIGTVSSTKANGPCFSSPDWIPKFIHKMSLLYYVGYKMKKLIEVQNQMVIKEFYNYLRNAYKSILWSWVHLQDKLRSCILFPWSKRIGFDTIAWQWSTLSHPALTLLWSSRGDL